MSIYILNKISTELNCRSLANKNAFSISTELEPSKVDPFAAKKERHFLQSFDFEDRYQKIGRLQEVLWCNFFLVGVLTVE
jgi:hypothetical protein